MALEVLAIIPARGGSKSIPRKNLVPICGRPLLAYSIDVARASRFVTRVVVSTEDSEIAEIAGQMGAEVVARPSDLATDLAATDPVLEQVVSRLEEIERYRPDLLVLLQPTSPLRPLYLVDACIERLLATDADSLLTVVEGHHFFWRRRGVLEPNYDPAHRPRRQDIPPEDRVLFENGSVYVTRRDILLQQHSRLWGRIEWYVMPSQFSVDIDSLEDVSLAEFVLRQYREQMSHTRLFDQESVANG